jgi:hypothetical protein
VGVPVSLALTGVAFAILLWMALPSVRTEGSVPKLQSNDESVRMGRWLSRGLDATSIVTGLFWIAAFVVPPLFAMAVTTRERGWIAWPPLVVTALDWLAGATALLLTVGGSAVVAFAAVLVTGIAKFGGTALDVVLDVDNYLRATPADAPPRARIAERYVSLLRHLAAEQPGRERYDAVIVVAHSLGGLISADLFRFLRREGVAGNDTALDPLGLGPSDPSRRTTSLYLFTMGVPLRQLLNRFFPHRYRWVRDVPDNGSGPVVDAGSDGHPQASRPPHPDASRLGVVRWDNAYRSGDYVGRSLWLEEWYARNIQGAGSDAPLRVEGRTPGSDGVIYSDMCIGAGAHTHYWDASAPEIARHLDFLIATA